MKSDQDEMKTEIEKRKKKKHRHTHKQRTVYIKSTRKPGCNCKHTHPTKNDEKKTHSKK